MRRGGPSAAVLDMVAALRRAGVEASILTTNDDGPGIDRSLPLGRWCDSHGVPVLVFPRWNAPLRALREFAIAPGLNNWLRSNSNDYDLIHVHALFSWPSSTAMLQARVQNIPYMLSTIGQLNRWSLRRSSSRKRLMLALVDRLNLSNASCLHFASEAERDEASHLRLPSPHVILPLGVTIPVRYSVLSSRIPKAETRFLFLSRLHPKKQIENLLEALSLVHHLKPSAAWRLGIAGNGEPAYLNQLQVRASDLGIAHRCDWLGFLEGDAKWQALQEADWFVLPSASENFGIAAIEALAVGTPPILSPDVAVSESIAAAGAGIVVSAAPAELAAALVDALPGPDPRMCCAARALAQEHYSWPVLGGRLRETYAAILAGRN
jgi:glycosyltransferase involved in cell wall biosynthesis